MTLQILGNFQENLHESFLLTATFCAFFHIQPFYFALSHIVALFSAALFFMLHFFPVAYFSYCTLFKLRSSMMHLFYVAPFSGCTLSPLTCSLLHFSLVAIFACCTFHVAICPCCIFFMLYFSLLSSFLDTFSKSIHKSSFGHISYNREAFLINLCFLT